MFNLPLSRRFLQSHRKLVLFLCSIVSSFLLTLFYIDLKVKDIYSDREFIRFPVDRINFYILIMQPMLILPPFLLIITIIGFYILFKNRYRVIIVQSSENIKNIDFNDNVLSQNEKLTLEVLFNSSGEMLQVDLREKTGLRGDQLTRILDRFEGLGWVTRKEWGRTNIVYLHLNPKMEKA